MSYPCSSCSRFMFALPTDCYWCRNPEAGEVTVEAWAEPELTPIEYEQRHRAKLKRNRIRTQRKKAAELPPVQETLI